MTIQALPATFAAFEAHDDLACAARWTTGRGVPDAGAGAPGDMYFDVRSGDIYGPRQEAGWGPVAGNIRRENRPRTITRATVTRALTLEVTNHGLGGRRETLPWSVVDPVETSLRADFKSPAPGVDRLRPENCLPVWNYVVHGAVKQLSVARVRFNRLYCVSVKAGSVALLDPGRFGVWVGLQPQELGRPLELRGECTAVFRRQSASWSLESYWDWQSLSDRVVAKSAADPSPLGPDDMYKVVSLDGASGPLDITLPSASLFDTVRAYPWIKARKADASDHPVRLMQAGQPRAVLTLQHQAVKLWCVDGTWVPAV